MERKAYGKLLEWKSSNQRKPLVVQGARQVGKSYVLETLGRSGFKNYFNFNFEKNKKLSTIFADDFSTERIVSELSLLAGKQIDIKEDLVIFDEIQECPGAITSLKYFAEDMPKLALCCAGSLLGVMLSPQSFPVGKVEFLNLYPMTFEEFLMALDDDISLELYDTRKNISSEVAHQRLWNRLKEYYITGGMPEVIMQYLEFKNLSFDALQKMRKVQEHLLVSYSRDFAKHAGKINSMHITSVFENVPLQLGQAQDESAKRYYFKNIIPNKRGYAQLRGPIDWLVKAGLLIKVKIANHAAIPLESFCKENIFKLYMFDIGLLGCMLDLPVDSLLRQDYGITKGFFAENFVAQEFLACGAGKLHAWAEGNAEIEFLRVKDGSIVPIEVKAGTRTQAKSMKMYIQRYHPVRTIKLSGNPLDKSNKSAHQNYPLYLAGRI